MAQHESKWVTQPVTRPKLYTAIADRIGEMLVNGDLEPGETLPSERELMDLFKVGRSSVREALMWLSSMGMIELNNGEKARIVAPSFDPLLNGMSGVARYFLSRPGGGPHLRDARMAFETGIVRQAASRVTDTQLEELKTALEANLAIAIDDFQTGERTDYEFHYLLASIPGNPIYTSLFDALSGWLREQRATSMQIPTAVRAAKAAHRRIFESVAARDPDAAAREMEHHLAEVAEYYQRAIVRDAPTVAGRPPRTSGRARAKPS